MATTSTGTTFTVNAWGQAAGGVWPHFKLLLDGAQIGQATVNTTTATKYSFTAPVAADQAHRLQVVYDNDAYISGRDRNLYVKSVEVNGKTMTATAPGVTYDKGALDGRDVIAGQEGMWWSGALNFNLPSTYFPAPATGGTGGTGSTGGTTTGSSQIVFNASGSTAGGVNAHFKVLVDGKPIGEGTATTTAKDYAFTTDLTPGVGHKVQIQFDNDAIINGQDRNLNVHSIKINGNSVSPTNAMVTIDKGALDGQDVVAGQSGIWWNGTMVVNAPASYFPGSATGGTEGTGGTGGGTTTPPPPPPPLPGLSVTDVTVTEPLGSITSKGIAPGFLHTEGSQIVDSAGNNVKLTGVNWFGAEGYAFAPQGLWMDSYQNQMNKMQELGFNVIRLPFSDAMLDAGRRPTGIDYSKNPDLVGKTSLEVFDKIVDYAGKIGMKIILDHHRSGDGASANENGLWYTSQYPESKMIENWKMLAQRYAGKDAVIGADLHNEPHNPATWGDGNRATDWAAGAERIGNAIQSVNKDWLLIVEGIETYQNQWYWWGGNLLGEKNRQVDFDVDNKLVYSVHDYGPSLHMMDWFKASNFPNNMPAKWDQMWGHFLKNDDTPILVGEFGSKMETTIDRAWMPKLVQYMNGDWDGNGTIDLKAGDQGASWTYWAWSPGSGDTGGIMNNSWQVDYTKYNAIKPGLFSGAATTAPGQTDATFTVKLAQASTQTVKVNFATVDGTAKAGSDYVASNGTLTFNPGETSKTIAVKVLGDSVAEGTETFSLKLSAASNATLADDTGLGTINNRATAAAAADTVDMVNHVVMQQQAAPAPFGETPALPPVDMAALTSFDMAYDPQYATHPDMGCLQ
ncbi:MAG TPA: carbohydrate-binding domain-containing protein [Azospirillum sp.]